jgi:hypothetical protein
MNTIHDTHDFNTFLQPPAPVELFVLRPHVVVKPQIVQRLSHFGLEQLTFKHLNTYLEAGSRCWIVMYKGYGILYLMQMQCTVRRRQHRFVWKVFYGTRTRTPKIRKCWGHSRAISAPLGESHPLLFAKPSTHGL